MNKEERLIRQLSIRKKLLKLLVRGRYLTKKVTPRNPLTSKSMLRRVGAVDGSEIRSAVHALRRQGIPIGSSASGYWLASHPAELSSTIATLKSRVREIKSVIPPLVKWCASMERYAEKGGSR